MASVLTHSIRRSVIVITLLVLAISSNVEASGSSRCTGKETESSGKLLIMATTDLHSYVLNWDYYQAKEVKDFGLVKVATLIKKYRDKYPSHLLLDNGDTIQGSPLGNYEGNLGRNNKGAVPTVVRVMNELKYDAATIGNHEFNFGLKYLNQAIKGSQFPWLCANVFTEDKDSNPNNDKHYFPPYHIFERKVGCHTLKVGVISLGLSGSPNQI